MRPITYLPSSSLRVSPTSGSQKKTSSSSISLRFQSYLIPILTACCCFLPNNFWIGHFSFLLRPHLYLQRTFVSCCIFNVSCSILSLIRMRSLSIYVLILFWRSAPLSPCSWPSVAIIFVFNPPGYLPFVAHLATISIQHKYFVFLHLLSTSELHLLIPFGVLRLSLFAFSPYLQSVEKILLLILIVVARLSSVSPSPEI
jgi:hypothetical protein